jgi:hypothetical protein
MKKSKRFLYIILFINVFVQAVYWLFLKEEILLVYKNPQLASSWFVNMIDTFYPRFFTEKHRFSIEFFLGKAEQILIRFAFLSILTLFFYYREVISRLVVLNKSTIHHFWNVTVHRNKVIFLQAFLAIVWIYESFTWYKSLKLLSRAVEFYEPHVLLKWIPFPSEEQLFYWFTGLYLAILTSFWKKWATQCWILAVCIILILQGFLYGFGKIDHTYATWGYVSMLIPFLLVEIKKETKEIQAWGLRLMQLVVACVYLQTGLEKLMIAGFTWFELQTLQTHLLSHPTALGLWVAQSDTLCVFLSIMTIVFEVGFISIMVSPKSKYIFLLMGVLFHTGTFVLMGVGGFPSLWWLVYVIWFLGEKEQYFDRI